VFALGTVTGACGGDGNPVAATRPPPGSSVAASVTILADASNLWAGDALSLKAELRDEKGAVLSGLPVSWASSNPGVASISGSGLVAAHSSGSTTITATSGNGRDELELTVVPDLVPAFPGAEGWGATALAACRRLPLQLLRVSSAETDGPGSLAQALRDIRSDRFTVIVFQTGGHIVAPSADGMRLSNGCVYVAGQTAPGDGVVIEGFPTAFWLQSTADEVADVVLRFIRFRGKSGRTNNNLIIAKGQRVILDHMSFSWTDNYALALIRYGDMDFSGTISDVSIQHSIVSEAFAAHPTGITINTNGALKEDPVIGMANVSIHRNLLAHNSHRNPMTAADNALVANNVVYNWDIGAGMMNRRGAVDWVNNVGKAGPMTEEQYTYFVNPYCDELGGDFSIYAAGNVSPVSNDPGGDNWTDPTRQVSCYRGTGEYDGQEVPTDWQRESEQGWRSIPFPIGLLSAQQAYDAVVADVGANARLTCDGRWSTALDPVDSRVIAETQSGSGVSSPPLSEAEVGGYPVYDPGSACPDADADGLPDAWEQRHYGCTACADPAALESDGYRLIEHYLNGTNPG
jgi:hypothetical protein